VGTNNHFLSIKSKQELIGTSSIYFEGDEANIGILIGKEYSGKGFGRKVWSLLVEEIAPSFGAKKVTGGTLEPNIAMVNLFEGSGMKIVSRIQGGGEFAGNPCDVLFFSKITPLSARQNSDPLAAHVIKN
jgi:RimJ/RimL family protein N-acetyltransferase